MLFSEKLGFGPLLQSISYIAPFIEKLYRLSFFEPTQTLIHGTGPIVNIGGAYIRVLH